MRKGNKFVSAYKRSFAKLDRDLVLTFKKRERWDQPDDGALPDAFFSYMNDFCPRLVLNDARVNCTNSIYRVFFKEDLKEQDKLLVAISLLSTFSQLSAEFEGRPYGSGVLKHEPSDMRKIRVLLPATPALEIRKTFFAVDRFMKAGDLNSATKAADSLILRNISETDVHALRLALSSVRNRRRATKTGQSESKAD
jgi:hypothetical protein